LYEFKLKKIVEFFETDMAGIVHFSNFFRYMEMAEHAFYRNLGWSVHPQKSELDVIWPRVSATCDYKIPLYFEDTIEIHLMVQKKTEKTIRYLFHFSKSENEISQTVAVGALTIVCSRYHEESNGFKSTPIPNRINEQIEVAPPEILHKS
jgi:YbgC/YbaW family acyl-CoA thioester hydrolase